MKIQLWVALIFATACHAIKLVSVQLRNNDGAVRFKKLVDEHDLDVWSASKQDTTINVLCSNSVMRKIAAQFSIKVLVENVEKHIKSSMKENELASLTEKQRLAKTGSGWSNFNSLPNYFPKYSEIETWLSQLAAKFSFVTVEDIGKTFEKRRMKVARIAESRSGRKPAVFVTGGIHAREWLGVATVNYMINEITKRKQAGDFRISRLLKKFDFYLAPVLNPDGYEYTFKNSTTRLWRKTKRPYKGCIGSDPNRNLDFHFGTSGVSKQPCSIVFPGPYAFSESCTQNFRDFVLSPRMKKRIKLYYDVHAYSQLYFVPYAYDKSVKAPDDAEVRRVAGISNRAIMRVNNRRFTVGTPGQILYDASGSTMDWMKGKANVKYAYAFEVYPTRRRRNGFLAKTNDIQPSGREILEGILTAAENIRI